MKTTPISPAATDAREHARTGVGQFGTQTHADSGLVDGPVPATDIKTGMTTHRAPSLGSADDRLLADRFRRAQAVVASVCRKLNLDPVERFPWVAQSNVAAAAWQGDPNAPVQVLDVPLAVVDHVNRRKSVFGINKAFLTGSERDVATFARFHLRFIMAVDNQARIDKLRTELADMTVEQDGEQCMADWQEMLRNALAVKTRMLNRQERRNLAAHARTAKRQAQVRKAAAQRSVDHAKAVRAHEAATARLDRTAAATAKARRVKNAEQSFESFRLAVDSPTLYCASGACSETNWGGHDRAHQRDTTCPPYNKSAMTKLLERARVWVAKEEAS